MKFTIIGLAAVALFMAGCTYTTKEECLAKGGKWELSGAGHVSGAQLPGCDPTPILP